MNLKHLTISAIAAGLEKKEFSSVELTRGYLGAIKHDRSNAFITVNEEAAVKMAQAADDRRSQGQGTILTGVPLAVKDVFVTQGLRSTAGSNALQNYIPPYTATAVSSLEKAGMVVLGKTNCDEFAMGASNENSAYGAVLHPLDPTRVTGGSSGGSAAAVAADLAPVAMGSDTGGSVRQPAAFCGVVGLKPTYGRISRFGLIAMASSLDTVGFFSRDALDAALLLQTTAGSDSLDATSSSRPIDNYFQEANRQPEKLTIGLPDEYFAAGLDERVRKVIEQAIQRLGKSGYTFKKVSLPHAAYALAAYYIVMPSEVSSNLSRYDGWRYGLRVEADNLVEQYASSRTAGFGAEVRRRVLLGTFALSAGYYDAYYLQAQKVRTMVAQDYEKVFQEVDVLLTPVTPNTAFKLGEKTSDPLAMYLEDIYTVSANISGIPGLSLPAGQVAGLPVGMQLLGPHWSESRLLRLAHHWQTLAGVL